MLVLPSLVGDKVGLFDHDRFRGYDLPFASLLRPADSLSTLHPGGCPRCVQDSVLTGGLGVSKVAFSCHWIPPCLLGATPHRSRTCAMHASGSSVASSVRQWRTKQATPRLAHHCADPGCAMLWSFLETVGEPGVSPRGPSRQTLCPAVPSLPWVPWVAVPHLPRYYAPLRLPPAPLGSLRSSLASRYRACFTAFVVSPSGSWPGRSPQGTPGPLVTRSPIPGVMLGARWFSHVPAFPL